MANCIKGQLSLEAITGANIAWQANKLEESDNMFIPGILNDQYGSVYMPFLGLQLKYKTNKYLDVNFEIQFSMKGQKLEADSYEESLFYLKYIQSFDVNILKDLKLGIGYFWGYRLRSDFIGINPQTTFNRENWDTGGVISTSYRKNRFILRVAYYYSLSTLYRINYLNEFGGFLGQVHKKNRAFQVGVGYTLSNQLFKQTPQS